MKSNSSKNFYLLCKKEGITKLDTKADISRVVLIAENNNIAGSEEELINKFNVERENVLNQENERKKRKEAAKISEIRKQEKEEIEKAKVRATLTGRDKPISACKSQIAFLEAKLIVDEMDRKAAIDKIYSSGMAMYNSGKMDEKDWAIHGGIASGIAGGAAGLATALEIQQQNAQAKQHNQQLMKSIAQVQVAHMSSLYNNDSDYIKEEINKLKKEIEFHKKRLVENLDPCDLLVKINPCVIKQEKTKTGAIKVTVQIHPIPDLKIYEKVNAVVDGSFKVLLIDGEEIVGEILYVLPNSGLYKKETLDGFCIDTDFDDKDYDVVFIPNNLWAIETKETISKKKCEQTFDEDYKNTMIYFSAKSLLMCENVDISVYKKAISILEPISTSESAQKIILECQSKIEYLTKEEERLRIERQKEEALRLEEQEKKAKRNKKIATIISSAIAFIVCLVILFNSVILPYYKYNVAVNLINEGKKTEALSAFVELGNFKNSRDYIKNILASDKKILEERISTYNGHTVGVDLSGNVVATGYNEYGQCNVSEWSDIIAVSTGENHTVGLKSDGTVVSTVDEQTQYAFSEWNDIVEIVSGENHVVGLKSDGTVLAYGNNEHGQCDVSEWSDIIAIVAGQLHTVGLKSDGTVVATGINDYDQCNVLGWENIEKIYATSIFTVGLKKDGTVVAAGNNEYGQCNLSSWTDIVDINVDILTTIGLKADGTVVAAGNNKYGQCDISDWRDVISIRSKNGHVVGLKSDGTVVSAGLNKYGQCDVSEWRDIACIFVGYHHTIGISLDGKVVAVGNNDYEQIALENWNLFK